MMLTGNAGEQLSSKALNVSTGERNEAVQLQEIEYA